MKILQILPSVDPTGGGPAEMVRQFGLQLGTLGHSTELATLDAPGSALLAGFPLPVHGLGPARGRYGYSAAFVPWLRAHANGYDAVLVHGLWQYPGFAARRVLRPLGVPYHVFTHGMLDPWFKRSYPLKHLKKWLYWPWGEYRVLRDARAVLFTCEEERRLARQSFWLYRAHERVVAFGTSAPPADGPRLRAAFLARHPSMHGKRLVLFLGRIHEKKGCDLLIQAFCDVAAQHPSLHLVMAGPDASRLTPTLQALAERVGVGARISWLGMIQGDEKWGAFYASEVFALPSHQENFGIAVAEALACGLPVLISDKVNIWREIQEAGAGQVQADTLAGTVALLRGWLALPPERRLAMQALARACFARHFSIDAMTASVLGVLGATADIGTAAEAALAEQASTLPTP